MFVLSDGGFLLLPFLRLISHTTTKKPGITRATRVKKIALNQGGDVAPSHGIISAFTLKIRPNLLLRKPLQLQPISAIVRPRKPLRWIVIAAAQPQTMRPFLVNMQIEWHTGFP
jgi:hypothetical protein